MALLRLPDLDTIDAGARVESPSNAALALAYADRGVRVFPCREDRYGPSADFPKGDTEAKSPCPGVMWQGPEPSRRASIVRWWRDRPAALIGVGLGERNLVVLDVDGGAEGVATWEDYCDAFAVPLDGVPYVITPTGGRHYFFRLPDGVTHGNARGGLPSKAVLPVDVRGGKSGYVIAAGTVRPFYGIYEPGDGNPFSWLDAPQIPATLLTILQGEKQHEDGDRTVSKTERVGLPAVISPPVGIENKRVRAWVERAFTDEIAGVATCGEGSRNEQLNKAAFALGQFVPHLLAEGEVRGALEQAARDCGLWKDDGPAQCRKTINSGLRGGMKDPRAIPADILAEEDEAAEGLAVVRGLRFEPNVGIVDEDTGEIVSEVRSQGDGRSGAFPEHLTYVPGLVGEITDWINATARRPSRVMALGAALALVGTAMGRYWAGPTKAGTHLYTLALAPTGAGKDHPMQQIRRVLIAAEMPQLLGTQEFQSSPSVINMVLKKPMCICTMDEFGSFLARVNSRKAGGFEIGISKHLRSLWGTNFDSFQTPEWAAKGSELIYAPCVGIYAASTPHEFFESLDSKQAVNGFLNRFLLLSVETKAAEVDPEFDNDIVPPHIVEGIHHRFGGGNWDHATKVCLLGSENVAPRIIPWAEDGARETYRAFAGLIERIGEKDVEAVPYLARTLEMAIRLATIRACGNNALKPVVTLADMEWGRDVAMHSAESMALMTGKYVADTDAQADAKRILRILEEGGGQMTKREMLRRLGHRMRERDLKDVLAALQASGAIGMGEVIPPGGGTKSLKVWIAS